jgi:hypothetical protein
MSTQAAVRRPTAAILAALVVVAALAVNPLGISAAQATTTPQQTAITIINLDRIGHVPAFEENGFVDDFAQASATNSAACGGCDTPAAAHLNSLAGTVVSVSVVYTQSTGGTAAPRPARIAQDFNDDWPVATLSTNTYGAVGYVTKGTTAYAALVSFTFSGTPTDETRAGTVTLPSSVKVGVPVVPVIKGFSPVPTSGFGYTWLSNGVTVATGTATYTPGANDLGKRLKLIVSEHNSGFSAAQVTSGQSGVVKVGTVHVGVWSVGGPRNVGQQLALTLGSWYPDTLSFQWYRNGVKISGATSSDYTQTLADLNKKIDVKITDISPSYTTVVKGTSVATKTGYPLLTSTPRPTIGGTAQYSWGLDVTTGSWGPGTVALKYQWRSNGVAIAGATHPTLSLAGSAGGKLIGTAITVTVTGSEAGYATTSVTSYPTADILRAKFIGEETPTITGNLTAGQTLTAHLNTWIPAPSVVTYQWFVNGIAVSGAIHTTYKVPVGALNVYVQVIGSKPYYQPVRLTSSTSNIS